MLYTYIHNFTSVDHLLYMYVCPYKEILTQSLCLDCSVFNQKVFSMNWMKFRIFFLFFFFLSEDLIIIWELRRPAEISIKLLTSHFYYHYCYYFLNAKLKTYKDNVSIIIEFIVQLFVTPFFQRIDNFDVVAPMVK